MNATAPLGSSSGLLHTAEHPAGQHADPHRAPLLSPTLAGLATSVLLHASIIVLAAMLIHEVPKLLNNAPEPQLTVPQFIPQPDLPTNPMAQIPSRVDGLNMTPATLGATDGENSMFKAGVLTQMPMTPSNDHTNGAMASLSPTGTIGTIDRGPPGRQLGHPDGERLPFIQPTGAPIGSVPVAGRVVFLCDATGTMTGLKFDLLKQQLKLALPKKPTTSFNIIFFGQDDTQTIQRNALLPATTQNRRKAVEFLDKADTGGSTNPIPGLEQAFALQPQVIYLLSDGEFDNLVSYDEVIRTVAELNKNREVRIYTILFGQRDDRAEQTLKQIAADHGGTFRFVSTEDLLKQ